MTVIARDSVASDHLVYAWPLPIGPDCEVTCADDEQVVMCPSYLVGDRLGPGRHRWRTPDPMRPVAAFFVLTSPVEAAFDMVTSFLIPATGQPIRLRASGSIQIRCGDPGLLIAQFVGLPFDSVNEGILRSVSRSIERMLARLLTRRVVMSGTAMAVTDPQMMSSIVEELIAYNPTAGAVFGVELTRMGHMAIAADDGSAPYLALPVQNVEWSGGVPRVRVTSPPPIPNGNRSNRKTEQASPAPPAPSHSRESIPLMQTTRGVAAPVPAPSRAITTPPEAAPVVRASEPNLRPSEPNIPSRQSEPNIPRPGSEPSDPRGAFGRGIAESTPPANMKPISASDYSSVVSGEIGTKRPPGDQAARAKSEPDEIGPATPEAVTRKGPAEMPRPRSAAAIEIPRSPDEITQPGVRTPLPPPARLQTPVAKDSEQSPRGSILGIGMAHIGSGTAVGEISTKVPPGGRVLVPGPNGLMQSATVRQLLSGYYELEVGSSGETIWVPMNGVVPE